MFLFCCFYLNYFLIPLACLLRKLTKIRHFKILSWCLGVVFFCPLPNLQIFSLFILVSYKQIRQKPVSCLDLCWPRSRVSLAAVIWSVVTKIIVTKWLHLSPNTVGAQKQSRKQQWQRNTQVLITTHCNWWTFLQLRYVFVGQFLQIIEDLLPKAAPDLRHANEWKYVIVKSCVAFNESLKGYTWKPDNIAF